MNNPNSHDGHFDGFRIEGNETLHLFLRPQTGESFTLVLRGVERLMLSEIKKGNIIFDLVFRHAEQLNAPDTTTLYDLDAGSPDADRLLKKARERRLQILELNPSYGALGLVLFEAFELRETDSKLNS
jgi:hypothetical protein